MKGKNIWDKQFSREPYSYGKDPNPFIRANSSYFEKNAHIACFAEGEGRNAIYLAKQNFSVTVFDLSSVGLTHAEQHAKQEDVQIQTRQTDLTEKIHFPNEYDGAILTFGHVHKDKQRT